MDNGTVFTNPNPVHNYSFPGIDIVKLAVTNSVGCIDSTEHEVRIDSLPIADFTFGPGCAGIETCFTDKSIPNSDSISSWFWEFGDGGTSILKDPCHIYLSADTFYVKLTVTNSNGCASAPKSDTLVVKGVPDAAFSAPPTCLNDTTFFTNETDTVGLQIDFWEWTFDDPASGLNNTSNLMHPNHLFTHEGEFSVKLKTGAYDGCIDSTINIIVVDSLPEADFIMPDTVAMGALVVFDDISVPHGADIYLRIWDFGDGTGANNPNPVIHTYAEPGNYTICLTITDIKGCIDTLCQTITVSALPQADFWYQSDTTLITEFFDHSFPDTIQVADWFWQFGDISAFGADTSHLQNPQYQYPQSGWYYVNLKITDNYGGFHDTTKAVYAGKAIVSYFTNEDVCFGDSLLFIDESHSPISASFEGWHWDFGDGSDFTYSEKVDSLYHYYELPGVYTVTLVTSATVNDGLLTDTLYKDVYVFNAPVAYFDTTELLVCKGTPIIFSDSSYTIDADSVTSWHWDFGDSNFSDLEEYPHIYSDTGNYVVTLTVATSHQCIDSVKANSMVAIAPDISFRIENACINSPARFIPDETTVKITDWWWDFGDKYNSGDTSSLSSPSHTYTRVDLYNVTMTASSFGCDKVEQKAFIVKPIPFSDFTLIPNFQNVQGKTSFTNNSIYASHYLWDFGNGETSTVADPIEIYEKDSTYLITLISYNQDGCADTSRYELLVFFRGLYFPTAFSPNNPNEGISKFTPKGVNLREYLVQVFDMGGNLMWESDKLDENGSPTESWDGYYNGLLMPQGMYIWKAQGTFKDGSIWKGSELQSDNPQPYGTVTLVR
ncbi:MAG: PKD domain-containing protein [Bacteroidales bacterium]